MKPLNWAIRSTRSSRPKRHGDWRKSVSRCCCLLFLLPVLSLRIAFADEARADVTAITNVRIETQSDAGLIENGIVVIRDGIIESVGSDIEIPEGVSIIDGKGATLTPGLIDSQSRLWLTPTSRSDTSSTAALRTVDGIDPFDESFKDVARQGVTSVAVAPQNRGRLGGSVALIAAGPTETIFNIPSRASFAEKEEEKSEPKESPKKSVSKDPTQKQPQRMPRRRPPTPGDKSAALTSRVASADEDDKKDADEKKEGKDSKDEKTSSKSTEEKEDKSDEGKKEDKEEDIEVPYSIERPPVPYSIGKQGWILAPDMAVQASLGIAATDGRGRISEFDALKKSLTEAEAYHKKWDEYRSWKAKQDKLPPDQRAKVETKRPTTTRRLTPEMMRRLAAMRAQRSGGVPSRPPVPTKEPEKKEESKKDDSKSGEEKKDDKKDKVVPKPDFDPAKDRLRPVLKGEIPLRMNVTDQASLERALELTKIADCQLVLVGATRLMDDALDEVTWPLIAGPWVGQDEDVIRVWKEQLETGDKRVCIGTFGGSGSESGTLRMQAAAAVAAGIHPNAVMSALTRSAAEVAGVGSWLGQIKPGFRADLVLFAGDPLDPATPVLQTMVAGKTIYNASVPPSPADDQSVIAVSGELVDRFQSLSMPKSYVLESRRILRPSGKFRSGRMTVVDGVITSVALDPLNGGAESKKSLSDEASKLPLLQLGDLVLTPGLVTAHLSLSSGSSTSEPDSSYYLAGNGFDFQSGRVSSLVDAGVLFAGIAPPSTNVLAGQIAAARLASDEPVFEPSTADKMVVSASARRSDRFPASMEGQFDFIRRRFAGDLEPNRTDMPEFVARTMREESKQRFEELASGKRLAVIEARSPAELRSTLRLIDRLKLNARLLLPEELKTVLPEVKRRKLGLVVRTVRPTDALWYLDEIIEAARAGAPVGIAADDAGSLRATAAMMVGQGMKPQRALKILTTEAARCVGMPKDVATLSVGQPADFVIWSGPPYKLTSRCLSVVADGQSIRDDKSASDELSMNSRTSGVSTP
ncbi:MAG: amidohydrolase family protein [Planctomycetota bacterium]